MELIFTFVKLTKNYARYQSGINTLYVPIEVINKSAPPKQITATVKLEGIQS